MKNKKTELIKQWEDSEILNSLSMTDQDRKIQNLFKANDHQVINEVDMEKQFDKYVLCGKETIYPIGYPVDLREGYVEGGGQTCPNGCGKNMIQIPESFFTENPNDIEFA